jgi:hypothetical protein
MSWVRGTVVPVDRRSSLLHIIRGKSLHQRNNFLRGQALAPETYLFLLLPTFVSKPHYFPESET